jgi:hypothetical protein
MKRHPKFLSWQCILVEISVIPDHELFLMLIKFSFFFANIGSSN